MSKTNIKQAALLRKIKKNLSSLENLLKEVDSEYNSEDLVYRYYHQSFKVYDTQRLTGKIYSALEKISPNEKKQIPNTFFKNIIKDGCSGRTWTNLDNENWEQVCRPFLEAFFHSRYFLGMAVKYGNKYKDVPEIPDFGWAALLELYGIRM